MRRQCSISGTGVWRAQAGYSGGKRWEEKYPEVAAALRELAEAHGQLHICFGSSYKTSDFIVDTLEAWWNGLPKGEQKQTKLLQLKVDNGPESSGVRTQFLKRMVEFSDAIGKPIQLLYYSPYHSKYN
ncbi:MAG TPA: hypothetical protein V6C65_26755, partial [Allocoleopsis sp.]